MGKRTDSRRLNAAKQMLIIRQLWPALQATLKRGTLNITGVVRPSGITRAYRIRVIHREGQPPALHVESPSLCRRPEQPDVSIPHTYDSDKPGRERPCVFFPDGREWHGGKPIAKTVIPWLLCWLVDYEVWLATGKWMVAGLSTPA